MLPIRENGQPLLARAGPYFVFPSDQVSSIYAPIYFRDVGKFDEEDEEPYFKASELFWRHVDHPVAWISDTRAFTNTSAARRATYAEYLKRVRDYQDKFLLCSAIIITNAEQRGITTSIRWQAQTKFQQECFYSEEDARQWCQKILRESGVSI